ncbi:MAG: cell wall hydrolase [Ruminococcus sp.]|nr:cell wall hydrolase [Ruminococcus sp.]
MGGGLGMSYVNSTFVDSTEVVEEVSYISDTSDYEVSETASDTDTVTASENAASNEKVTTSNVASEMKSVESGNNESSTSEISTAVNTANATSAALAATVPAPVHALAAEEPETEPITEAQTEPVAFTAEATAESVIAPIPPSTEALTQTPDQEESVSTADTASDDTSGTTVVYENSYGSLPITDEEYIILCNAVANEAGSDWISVYDKARVVEVIMNRVNSGQFPNTIYGVLAQPFQFEGSYSYVNLGTFSSIVTDAVKEAVDLYFSSPESFSEGYFYFYGDGYQNYFY